MIGTAQLAKAIGRVIFTLLLALAATTPSLAELGLLESPAAHRQEAGVSHHDETQASESPDSGEDSDKSGGPSHCQFTHCLHGLASRAPDRSADQPYRTSLAYPAFLTHRLVAAPRDGPEHPPRV